MKKFKKGEKLFSIEDSPSFSKCNSYIIKKVYRDVPQLIVKDDTGNEWVFNTKNKLHTFYIWKFFDENRWLRDKRKLKLQQIENNATRY